MPETTLTSKGQLTLPKTIREALELGAGDRLHVELREDGVIEMRRDSTSLEELCGILKPRKRGVTIEEMDRAVRERAAREFK
ncbi:MAG: type II toxin-antitoxin system PrlF family antitoxin [Myxococcota bacterium]